MIPNLIEASLKLLVSIIISVILRSTMFRISVNKVDWSFKGGFLNWNTSRTREGRCTSCGFAMKLLTIMNLICFQEIGVDKH